MHVLLGERAGLLVNRADLHDRLQGGGALEQHHQLAMSMARRGHLQRFRGRADACLHLRLLENELDGIGAERVVDRAQRHAVGVAALLRQCPLEAVGTVDADDLILRMSSAQWAIRPRCLSAGRGESDPKRSPGSSPRSRCMCTT